MNREEGRMTKMRRKGREKGRKTKMRREGQGGGEMDRGEERRT